MLASTRSVPGRRGAVLRSGPDPSEASAPVVMYPSSSKPRSVDLTFPPRRRAATFPPSGVGIFFEFVQPTLCGCGVMHNPSPAVEDQDPGGSITLLHERSLREEHRRSQTGAQVRGNPP